MYPSVCLQSINEEIQSNFNGTLHHGFLFDLEGFKNELSQQEFRDITEYQVKTFSMNELIKSYLIHNGYIETLQAIEEDTL